MFEMLDEWPEIMNINEVAEILCCKPLTISKLCREGKIKAMKIGKCWSIPKFSLRDFILFQTGYGSAMDTE